MHRSPLSVTLTIAALMGAACSDGTQEQSPGEVLARDSTLASGLKQADTSSFAAPDADTSFAAESAASAREAPPPLARPQIRRPLPAKTHPAPRPLRPTAGTAAAILEIVPGAALAPRDARHAKTSPRVAPR